MISVVIPTRNRAGLVCRAVRSVLSQSHRNLECIVVDDASDDGTAAKIEALGDPRLKVVVHDSPRHASAARNTGIAVASGTYIAFLDDDDEWLPTKLARQLDLLRSLPEPVGMVYCWVEYLDNVSGRVTRYAPTLTGNVFPEVFDRQRIGPCSSLMVRRDVLEVVGGFDDQLPRGNDGDFIRRVCRQYEVDYVPEILVRMHTGHGYERITRSDEEGLSNAVQSELIKLRKFSAEAAAYPKRTARILAKAASASIRLGRVREGWALYRRALVLAPWSLTVYRQVGLGLRVLGASLIGRRAGPGRGG